MTDQPTADPRAREPEFGPGGYLPDRAARRARKIILREQMSAGWPLAALVAALVLLVAGGIFLLTRTGGPGTPFTPVVPFADLAPRSATLVVTGESGSVLVVHTGSAVRALEAPADEVAFCPASGHLESPAGSVWAVGGQRLGGSGDSLGSYPVRVHSGTVYVDATEPVPAPSPAGGQATPACH